MYNLHHLNSHESKFLFYNTLLLKCHRTKLAKSERIDFFGKFWEKIS